MEHNAEKMEKIMSLSKRRGFVFQGSEIYGGLKGVWDLGPLGVLLSNNIKRDWWKRFVEAREDMYGLDTAILMNEKVLEASGHVGAGFSDLVTTCEKCHKRFRADHIGDTEECPECGGSLSDKKDFNLMFETKVGAEGTSKAYLRPETAQGIFVNFKNILDSMSPKMPFGIAQIGKAFRNEIAPREFLFRVREFEQMEIEFFVKEIDWKEHFEAWRTLIKDWFISLGLSSENLKEIEVSKEDLAHYSKRTIDFEYNYPGKGFGELSGLAYRTDYDLNSHMEASGVSLEYLEPDGNKFVPHVIEPSFGAGRTFLAVLSEAYQEDEMGGETRTYLKLPAHIAPYRAAVSPLLKNKTELVDKAREVFGLLKKELGNVAWDDNGNIGKRYRRQDEIGTPHCIVIDFETLGQEDDSEKDTVTVRDRDTGKQERLSISELVDHLRSSV